MFTFEFSKRANNLESAAIHDAAAKLRKVAEAGGKTYNFITGAVGFGLPEDVLASTNEAIIAAPLGNFGAVGGQPDTVQAILRKFERENGIAGNAKQVIVCNGGKEVISDAMEVLINEGDEVVFFAPYWPSYESFIRREGGKSVIIQPEGDNLRTTPEQLQRAMTDKTKLVIINNPQNPSGVVYTREELEAFAAVIAPTKAAVIADECFELFNYSGQKPPSFATLPDMAERTFTANGIGKSYGKPGLRIGYGMGPEPLIKKMHELQSSGPTHANIPGQAAASFLLSELGQGHVPAVAEFVLKNRDIMIGGLKAIPQLKVSAPEGSYFAFPDVSGCYGMRTPKGKTIASSGDVRDFLLENGIGVLDGKHCGMEGHVRIAYTAAPEQVAEGVQAIQEAFKKLVRVPGIPTPSELSR